MYLTGYGNKLAIYGSRGSEAYVWEWQTRDQPGALLYPDILKKDTRRCVVLIKLTHTGGMANISS